MPIATFARSINLERNLYSFILTATLVGSAVQLPSLRAGGTGESE